jgi:hypothetical protein
LSRHLLLSGGFTRQFVQTPTLVWRFHQTVCPDTYPCLEVSPDSLSRHLPLSGGFTRQFVQTPTLIWRFHQTVCPDTYPYLEVSPDSLSRHLPLSGGFTRQFFLIVIQTFLPINTSSHNIAEEDKHE